MPFDLEGARKEGTDAEIAEYLAGQLNFDIQGARAEGNDSEIAEYLATQLVDTQPAQETSPLLDVGKFSSEAIASTLGAPVDIVASGLSLIPGVDIKEPIGGAESIRRGFEAIGTTFPEEGQEPETLPQFIGQGVGEVAGALLPFTKATQVVSKGKGLVGKISKTISDSMIKSPFLSAVSETAGGAGAGTGRFVAEEVAPDQPLVRSLAEIGGGVVGGLAPSAVVGTARRLPTAVGLRKGKELVQKARLPFTEKGAEFRAGEFLKKQVVSPEETARRITEPTIGELTPVIASKEKKLLALYNQIKKSDPEVDADAIKRASRSVYKLEQELRGLGYGAPEVLKDTTNKRIASIELKINKRINDAMGTAQSKLDKLPVATRRSKESIIVRNELEKARALDISNNKDLWLDVPKGVEVDVVNSKNSYKSLLSELSRAEKGDAPSILTDSILTDKSNITTVKEAQGLRSKLLEAQRIARKNGEWNSARIAGNMADNLLDDMDVGTDDALSVAIDSTRLLKSKYEKGIVAKILGLEKSGAPSISPELTLDVSAGRAGTKGAVDIEKVAVTPEAVEATKRFINRSFTDFATDKGTKAFNATKAQKWITSNEEILDKFPEIRTQMQDINTSQELANSTLATMKARKQRIKDPRISVSARFLKSDLGKEIPDIIKSENPAIRTRELVKQARKDPSGESLEGLKGAFVDDIIDRASTGSYNELGEQNLSGNALAGFVNKNRKMLREVFDQDELVRLEKIGKELSSLEMAEKVSGDRIDLEIDDLPSNFLKTISRVSGAQLGRWVAGKTGGGTVQTPAIFSEKFKGFAQRLTKDRAQQLVYDAITSESPKLLETLLLPINKPVIHRKNLEKLSRAVNLWLLGTGNRVMQDIETEIMEEQGMLQERPEGLQSTLGGQ